MKECWIIKTEVNWHTDREESEFHRDKLMVFDDERAYNMHRGKLEKQIKMFNSHISDGQQRMKCYKIDVTHGNVVFEIPRSPSEWTEHGI